ncbi:chemotaxis-specific protein-glutamate methyltransferase CheB [Fulvivirga lutimaris]|uniref:chemotaxis-specific protein-glutamate methyltransferase CheB n=1 Tax=Fulvivirga lutimaris TaxID=1819566 RepID=UPI0012BD2999|nr:chemotaxis-specific protein-glutamate methyltransferase CheB [Fulvivirga lutimaris]MTI40053.1 chemotaxis-specific protein-glutamate methyltransferase CheB [Fulvivirga lutimaris]
MIKALVVEDSGLMRILISDILRSDKSITSIETANNGFDALAKIKANKPDVIITDMVMPGYDGLYLVKNVMKDIPTPIIVLSSLERTNEQIFDALKCGAFEFLDKPKNGEGFKTNGNYPLLDMVKLAAGADSMALLNKSVKRNDLSHTFDNVNYDIVAVGASTGGPSAIESLIEGLPANFPVPMVIAQHMPERFIESFAIRINNYTPLNVKIPRKGEGLEAGNIYIAPGTGNLVINRNAISNNPLFGFSPKHFKEFNNPSVDCLFESVSRTYKNRALGVVLTGMGKDGMVGLQAIKSEKGYAIAQDEKSSVVFGMPKAAIDAKTVDNVVNIKEMAGFITSCLC